MKKIFRLCCIGSLLMNIVLFLLLVQLQRADLEKTPFVAETTVVIEKVYYGNVVGRGIITDPADVAVVLDCIDHLEFYADDIDLAYMGGGIEVYLYQDSDVKSYTFGDGAQIKDHQDPHPVRWFRSPGESIVPFLEEHIQKTYPYPEFR